MALELESGPPDAELAALIKELDKLPSVNTKSLQISDDFKIQTKSTLYTFTILDAENGLVEIRGLGKHSYRGYAIVLGSVIREKQGSIALKTRWVAIGFSVLIYNQAHGFLMLPATQEVWLNGKRILPDLSRVPRKES